MRAGCRPWGNRALAFASPFLRQPPSGRFGDAVTVARLSRMNPPGFIGGEERRADHRYEVSFRVNRARGDSPDIEGEISDLSAGGCFVESDEEVREGDLVKLRLDIPGRGDLTIWGDITFWVKDTGFGVHFSAFSQGGARDKLLDLLRSAR